MAFDGALPAVHDPAPLTPIPAVEQGLPVHAGGDISVLDRVVLLIGYGAFGLALGAGAALLMSGLPDWLVLVFAAAPASAAVVMAGVCARQVNVWLSPLIVIAVATTLAAVAAAFLLEDTSRLAGMVCVGAGVLAVTVLFCRRFVAAFSLALLGLLLAAPVGAAAMRSVFG